MKGQSSSKDKAFPSLAGTGYTQQYLFYFHGPSLIPVIETIAALI